jgi:hypothetical protein
MKRSSGSTRHTHLDTCLLSFWLNSLWKKGGGGRRRACESLGRKILGFLEKGIPNSYVY